MRSSRFAVCLAVAITSAVCGLSAMTGTAVAVPNKFAPRLALREGGTGGQLLPGGSAIKLGLGISPAGVERSVCRGGEEMTLEANEQVKDRIIYPGYGGYGVGCDPGYSTNSKKVVSIELGGDGAATIKLEKAWTMDMPQSIELCEPGGKCGVESFDCAYRVAKAAGRLQLAGFLNEVPMTATGKRYAKESDPRCARTQQFELSLAFKTPYDPPHKTTDEEIWASD